MSQGNSATPQKKSLWGKIFKYAIPPLITVGLCWVLFHDQNLSDMTEFISHDCDFAWIGVSMVLIVLSFVWRGLRWRIQLQASGVNPSRRAVVGSIVGTYAVNLVFPRAGEVWRSGFIAQHENAPFATVFGSMIADRLADTLTVLILFLATFFFAGSAAEGFISQNSEFYQDIANFFTSVWLYVALTVVAVAAIWFFLSHTSNRHILRARAMARQLGSGIMAIFHMKGAWRWLLLTGLLWGTYFISLLSCFFAFGFTRELFAHYGFAVVAICFVLSSISMGVPSTGGIGPYQASMIFAMSAVASNVDKSQALGFANVVLGAQIVTIILCGIPVFIAIAMEKRHKNSVSIHANKKNH